MDQGWPRLLFPICNAMGACLLCPLPLGASWHRRHFAPHPEFLHPNQNRRKPPPPRRKARGVGRGRKKKGFNCASE